MSKKQKHSKKLYLLIPLLIVVGFGLSGLQQDQAKPPQTEPPAQAESKVQQNQNTTEDSSANSKPDANTGANQTTQNTERTKSSVKLNPTPNHQSKILPKSGEFKEVRYYLLDAPNDPYYSSDWAKDRVQSSLAWELTPNSSDVTVAVIDSGFNLNHEDLTNQWEINSNETGQTTLGDICWTGLSQDKSSNNCDDDNNGYSDDWRGYDFFNVDSNPDAGSTNPGGEGAGHGTMVAGVVSATTNNFKGSAGISKAKVMPLQIFSDDGEAYTSDIVAAIEYATDNDADIINLSLGTNFNDPLLLAAIRYAKTNGTLIVAASGNCALNDEPICNDLAAPGRMTYPALYDEVLSVGATTSTDARASFSSYGPALDLVAPGQSIGPVPSYNSNGSLTSYVTTNGTSFSSPLTAGVAALLKSQYPQITPDQTAEFLNLSADKVPGMTNQDFTEQYGYGRINAHKATLFAKSNFESTLIGQPELSPKQPAEGKVWKLNHSTFTNQEWALIECKINSSFTCLTNLTKSGGQTLRYQPIANRKGNPIQYTFIRGSQISPGNWQVYLHSNEYASSPLTDLINKQ